MYQYIWDETTGGLLLTPEQSKFSKEPRPVYYKELDILGFDKYWNYPKDDHAPLMWAETNSYIYKGRTVAKTRGGSLYTAPELILLDNPEPDGKPLHFVDVDAMVKKNHDLLETLVQETIQKIYNTYMDYKATVDVFYVAFSGGKDSIVALDLVQRTLPHSEFKVLFGDTQMEFPDTYDVVTEVEKQCATQGIEFHRARSKQKPNQTWSCFGPPSTSNRWCCSVHKTSPQINLLRQLIDNYNFTGMAFTGVRAEESQTRSGYDDVSEGKKHQGQYSCHVILQWSTAELYNYIYENHLILNNAYLKGNVRAGCLVCPNSSGKHEYIKHVSYKESVDKFIQYIIDTSGKTDYSDENIKTFIDSGFWRTRKTGRELNFEQDMFEIQNQAGMPVINVFKASLAWIQWGKTIGEISEISDSRYSIRYQDKSYVINIETINLGIQFQLLNCENSRTDIKFQSLFRSVIVKSIYCVGCGACEAECKFDCIHMENGISIGDNCRHCHKCHEIQEHCLRYNSIRNKITEGKKMAGLDRYFTFGTRTQWLDVFAKYQGSAEFWESDGDTLVANKKKDAFLNFLKDANMVSYNKKAGSDKYTKYIPNEFANVVFRLGSDDIVSWSLIYINLVYTPTFNWVVTNMEFGKRYTPDLIKLMLSDVMENDTKGIGKRNVVDALKVIMAKTPLGTSKICSDCDVTEKINSAGNEVLTLNAITRTVWDNPVSEVILYSLYKFAEACDGYYQFSLQTLMDNTIDREGVSPSQIFGLDQDTMVKILNGLSMNYPEFISVSFTLDLNSITLRENKTSIDVLKLF